MDPVNPHTTDQTTMTEHREVEIAFEERSARLAFHAEELVGQLRDEAVGRFELEQAPSEFALVGADGLELNDQLTFAEAGIDPGSRLRLVLMVVKIICNARAEVFAFVPGELVGKLRETAVQRFGIVQNPHLYSLFTEANRELPDDQTLRQANVRPGELLVLRQSTVRGGSR
jgi:hypothetical protein